MNMKNHMAWMIGGFIVLVAASQFIGPAAYWLFPVFCIVMMGAMMFGMDHGKHDNSTEHKHNDK